jgi:tetratricopeptide (TPR) repeat protein
MASLSAFNPHEMKAETVLKVATGRDEPLGRLLDIVRDNLNAPTKQHVIVSAPRGYGKSFLLRYVQVKIAEIAKDEGLPVSMALLPEELPHVKEPDTLLAEIRRTFLNEPADTVQARWVEDDGEAWYQRVAELDAAITERLGPDGLLIAGVENFDLLIKKAFAKDLHAGRLREFLTRKDNRVMLLAASARGAFDRDYNRPLFKAFEEVALEPWTVDECVVFFRAQRAAAKKQPLTEAQEAKARAVATFIGGTPRLATLIGEALLEDDPLRAADLLDRLVDELTPYYKERIEALPTRSQALLDGLLRGGEKCSATELARRVGAPSQPSIAAPLDELRRDLVVIGEKAPDSAEVLLRVSDRVFAHYYRKRILAHGQETCPLEALVDLLAVFYSPDEQRREAEKLKARGLAREAAVMERLWQAGQAKGVTRVRAKLDRVWEATFQEWMDEWDRVTDEGRFEEGLLILDKVISAAREINDTSAECEALSQRAWTLFRLFRYGEALANAREAVALAERVGEAAQAFALNSAAFCLMALERYDEALATARDAVALANRVRAVSTQGIALNNAAFSLSELSRHDEALATAREAAALAERAGDASEQVVALRYAAISLSELGRHDEALANAREAAALAERAGDVSQQAEALRQVAFILNELERYDEALAAGREAAAFAERAGNLSEQATSLRVAAFSLNLLRRHDEAFAIAREAAALAEREGEVSEQVEALRQAVFSLNELERYDEALAIAREAAGLAERVRDIDLDVSVAGLLLTFRTRIGLDEALTAYGLLAEHSESTDENAPSIWFDDIAHVVTAATAWPRLIAILNRFPKAAEQITKETHGLAEGGDAIAAAHTGQPDAALAQARHFVAALAQATETAPAPALAQLWSAVLNASAEQIATRVEDIVFLREFADTLTAHPSVPARAKDLIAAAAAFHSSGRDPAALARLEPDLATTLMAVFKPKSGSSKRQKPRVRPKR